MNSGRAGTLVCSALLLALLPAVVPPALAQVSIADMERRVVDGERTQREQARRVRAEAQVAVEARRRARLPHLVHRNEAFWSDKPALDTGRALFEGRFADVDDDAFARFFVSFVVRYSADCGDEVAAGVFRRFRLWRGDDDEIVHIEPRFVERFRELFESRYVERADEAAFLEGLFSSPQQWASTLAGTAAGRYALYASIRRFNGVGCNSASSVQLRENLHRRMSGLPSLQATGGSVVGAARESDPLPEPEDFYTVVDACVDYHAGRQGDWCACIDRQARRELSYDDYLYYAARFEALRREFGTPSSAAQRIVAACRAP